MDSSVPRRDGTAIQGTPTRPRASRAPRNSGDLDASRRHPISLMLFVNNRTFDAGARVFGASGVNGHMGTDCTVRRPRLVRQGHGPLNERALTQVHLDRERRSA